MIGVVVKKNGEAIEKRVMTGNDEKSFKSVAAEQLSCPDKEFIVFSEAETPAFEAVEVKEIKSANQAEWDTLKADAKPVDKFFAKMLGLNDD